jgi:23S rRNA pseudouridine2605 synthase
MSERLSKFLSHAGIASRRKCEGLVASGRVTVNGTVVTSPFHQVAVGEDIVTLDGITVNRVQRLLYIALHKPAGYISDLADPRGRKLARDLIPIEASIFPVGRLDYNSEGLLLFTNDGSFANFIMHPRYETEKEYLVKLQGKLTDDEQKRMISGIIISSDVYKVKDIGPVRESTASGWYRIIVAEGKNRMIRKLSEAVNHRVLRLKRIRIDGILLGDLQAGQYRHIDRNSLAPLLTRTQRPGGSRKRTGRNADSRDKFH